MYILSDDMNTNTVAVLCVYIWIVCWILAIWHSPYNVQWFLTGLFSIALGLIFYDKESK